MRFSFTILGLFYFLGLSKLSAQTVTDIDGNVYNTVNIGTQVWMKENLNTTRLNNGTLIPNITDTNEWSNIQYASYCDYNNSLLYSNIYGKLYNGYAAAISSLCPINWHVASDYDWTQLTNFLGGDSVAGGKLKEVDTTYWQSPNIGATNSSGFTALPGGDCLIGFGFIGVHGHWWTSTGNQPPTLWYRELRNANSLVGRAYMFPNRGYSVRCIRDLPNNIENLNNLQKINIYPNPANDKIEIIGINNGIIELINMQGQIVQTANLLITKTILDISKLSSGFYALKIISDNGIIVKKIIKQ